MTYTHNHTHSNKRAHELSYFSQSSHQPAKSPPTFQVINDHGIILSHSLDYLLTHLEIYLIYLFVSVSLTTFFMLLTSIRIVQRNRWFFNDRTPMLLYQELLDSRHWLRWAVGYVWRVSTYTVWRICIALVQMVRDWLVQVRNSFLDLFGQRARPPTEDGPAEQQQQGNGADDEDDNTPPNPPPAPNSGRGGCSQYLAEQRRFCNTNASIMGQGGQRWCWRHG